MTNKFGRHIFVVLLILSINYTVFAQGGRMRMQQGGGMQQFNREPNFNRPNNHAFNGQPTIRKIQIIKENFVNKQLALTSEQSEKFLPLYHQYQQELYGVFRLRRLNNTDAQANGTEQINKNLAYEKQIVDIKAHYTQEFLKILPPEKVSLITKSEREFNDEMIRQPAERNTPPPSN
jgi:hypothetical protein